MNKYRAFPLLLITFVVSLLVNFGCASSPGTSEPVDPPLFSISVADSITYTSAGLTISVTAGSEEYTEFGVCWKVGTLTSTSLPTVSDSRIVLLNFFASVSGHVKLTGLTPSTIYNTRVYIRYADGRYEYSTTSISFTTIGLTDPTLNTSVISGITATTAIGGGNIASDGGVPITARGVCWTSSGNNPTIADNKTVDGSGIGSFTSNLTGLTAGVSYKVAAYATNTRGTFYGTPLVFSSATVLPSLATIGSAQITGSSATLLGDVSSDGGSAITEKGICWGLSSGPTTANSKTVDSSTGVGSYVSNMTGLSSNSTYYVRAYATSIYGTFYGNEISFRNTALLISTAVPSNLGSTTVISGGIIATDGGLSVTQRGVCWSTSSGPTTAGSKLVDSSTGIGSYTSSITGLTSGTTYYLRAYAITSSGTSYGEEVTFKTTSLATLTTTAGAVVDMNSATSGGNITNDGGATVTSRGICWSMSPNPTTADSKTTDGSGTGVFTSTLTSLQIGGTYHIRAYAINSVGTAYGNDVTYVVDSSEGAVIMTQLVTDIMSTSAVCGGIVFNDGGFAITSRGVCWSTSSNPTTANSKTVDGSGLGTFVSNMTGLSPHVTYYVRSYVVSSHGTTYGGEFSFTTHP